MTIDAVRRNYRQHIIQCFEIKIQYDTEVWDIA